MTVTADDTNCTSGSAGISVNFTKVPGAGGLATLAAATGLRRRHR